MEESENGILKAAESTTKRFRLQSKESLLPASSFGIHFAFTKATQPTTGNLPEHPRQTEESDLEVLNSVESLDNDVLSPPPPSLLIETTPTPLCKEYCTASGAQHSLQLTNQQPDDALLTSGEQPQSSSINLGEESSVGVRKQRSGKKRSIPTKDSDVDNAVAEYYKAKKSALSSKDGRKEGIVQFLNSLVPDLLQLSDSQLRSFKRRSLLLIDEVTGTTPLESLSGSRYPISTFDPRSSSQTPSPAATFVSSYNPSSPEHLPNTLDYTNL